MIRIQPFTDSPMNSLRSVPGVKIRFTKDHSRVLAVKSISNEDMQRNAIQSFSLRGMEEIVALLTYITLICHSIFFSSISSHVQYSYFRDYFDNQCLYCRNIIEMGGQRGWDAAPLLHTVYSQSVVKYIRYGPPYSSIGRVGSP